jgi:iron complex outermembrane receptor protein
VRVNLGGLHYDYSNIQVSRFSASRASITNGSKAKLYGFDLDGEWVVMPNFTLNGGFSYVHSEFTEFPNADFYVPVGNCVPAPGGVCPGNAAGHKLPYAPETTVNIGGNYQIETKIGKFAANVNYFHSAEFFVAPANVGRQGAYGLVNASVSWTDASDHYSVKVWGKNITDTKYNTSMLESAPGMDVVRGYPATYGLTAGYRF